MWLNRWVGKCKQVVRKVGRWVGRCKQVVKKVCRWVGRCKQVVKKVDIPTSSVTTFKVSTTEIYPSFWAILSAV